MKLGHKFNTGLAIASAAVGSFLVATPDAQAESDLFVTQDFIITSNTVVAGGTLPDIGNGTTGFFTLGINTIGAVDQDPSAAVGQYAGTIEDFFLSLDTGHAFIIQSPSPLPTSLSDNNITTGNNFSGSTDAFGSIFNAIISELNGSGVTFNGVSGFVDAPRVTDTTSIIGSALDFSDFTGTLSGNGFDFIFNGIALEGTVTSFEATRIPEPSALLFQFTEFDYNKEADTLTFVWNSTPDTSYSIVYTEDPAAEFSNVLIASVPSAGASTSYGPVASPVPGADQLFFKVVENE